MFYAGAFVFDGGGDTFPGGSSPVELTSPFVLSSGPANKSFLQGFLTQDLQGPPLFSVDLTGRGVAIATFNEGLSPELFFFDQVTYAFAASPQPVPEPTSMLLLATGLIGGGAWRPFRVYRLLPTACRRCLHSPP